MQLNKCPAVVLEFRVYCENDDNSIASKAWAIPRGLDTSSPYLHLPSLCPDPLCSQSLAN